MSDGGAEDQRHKGNIFYLEYLIVRHGCLLVTRPTGALEYVSSLTG
jgi:hypothetical protein